MPRPNHAHVYTDRRESSVFVDRTKQALRRDIDDDRNGAHLTSFGIEFQAEEAKEYEPSLSVSLLRAGLLRSVMVCELVRVLLVCDGFFCSASVKYDDAVLL